MCEVDFGDAREAPVTMGVGPSLGTSAPFFWCDDRLKEGRNGREYIPGSVVGEGFVGRDSGGGDEGGGGFGAGTGFAVTGGGGIGAAGAFGVVVGNERPGEACCDRTESGKSKCFCSAVRLPGVEASRSTVRRCFGRAVRFARTLPKVVASRVDGGFTHCWLTVSIEIVLRESRSRLSGSGPGDTIAFRWPW